MVNGSTGGIEPTAEHQMMEVVNRVAELNVALGIVRGAGLYELTWVGNILMEKGADGTGMLDSPLMKSMARNADTDAGSELEQE